MFNFSCHWFLIDMTVEYTWNESTGKLNYGL